MEEERKVATGFGNTEVNTDCGNCFNGVLGAKVLLKWVQRRVDIKHIDQLNRIESPEINSYIYDQLTCNKSAKTINTLWKNCLFHKVLSQLDIHIQKNEVGFLPHTM